MDTIPPEIYWEITNHLSFAEYQCLARVCRYTHNILMDPKMQKDHLIKTFGKRDLTSHIERFMSMCKSPDIVDIEMRNEALRNIIMEELGIPRRHYIIGQLSSDMMEPCDHILFIKPYINEVWTFWGTPYFGPCARYTCILLGDSGATFYLRKYFIKITLTISTGTILEQGFGQIIKHDRKDNSHIGEFSKEAMTEIQFVIKN